MNIIYWVGGSHVTRTGNFTWLSHMHLNEKSTDSILCTIRGFTTSLCLSVSVSSGWGGYVIILWLCGILKCPSWLSLQWAASLWRQRTPSGQMPLATTWDAAHTYECMCYWKVRQTCMSYMNQITSCNRRRHENVFQWRRFQHLSFYPWMKDRKSLRGVFSVRATIQNKGRNIQERRW